VEEFNAVVTSNVLVSPPVPGRRYVARKSSFGQLLSCRLLFVTHNLF